MPQRLLTGIGPTAGPPTGLLSRGTLRVTRDVEGPVFGSAAQGDEGETVAPKAIRLQQGSLTAPSPSLASGAAAVAKYMCVLIREAAYSSSAPFSLRK